MVKLVEDGPDEVIGEDDVVDEVNIEEYGKAGRKPPRARVYVIRVGKQTLRIEKPDPAASEILTLAGKVPVTNYILMQISKGGQAETIPLDQKVDLTKPGVEKFKTLPRDQTEG